MFKVALCPDEELHLRRVAEPRLRWVACNPKYQRGDQSVYRLMFIRCLGSRATSCRPYLLGDRIGVLF